MYKTFEYICTSLDCSQQNIEVERFVGNDEVDTQECDLCHKLMKRIFSSIRGIVRGTSTPVKQ